MITKTFINDIRAEIAAHIESEQDDVFGSISAFPKSTMEGFPALVIKIAENETAFASTGSQDSRKMSLVFRLNVYYPAQKEDEQEDAEMAMGEAVSELLRILAVKNPFATVDLSSVGMTDWGEEVVNEATFRYAQVIIRVSKYVDTQ